MLETLLEILGAVLLLGGCALATIGLYGLILKPDLFDQLHVAGLVGGPGIVLVLLASLATGSAEIVTSAALVLAFVLVTSSISTHLIAYAGVRRYGPVPDRAALRAADRGLPAVTAQEGPSSVPVVRSGRSMRVIVAPDGSAGSDLAIRLAASIEWPEASVLRLASPSESRIQPAIDPWTERRRRDPTRPAASSEVDLGATAGRLERSGLRVETVAIHDGPGDVLVDAATFGADLIVTAGSDRFVRSLLGWSAAGETVGRAPCPVLVARTERIREVLLTSDGSSQSAAAAELLTRWSIFDLARIRVVAVRAEAGASGRRFRLGSSSAADQRAADLAAARLMDAGREVVTDVLSGRPGPRIIEAARRHDIDLIVIGSRGRTGLSRTLLGSVAGEVLAAAPCSVLIIGPPLRRPLSGPAVLG